MYGFGDDKQVSADTVAVMEEILIEYIVDVVRPFSPRLGIIQTHRLNQTVSNRTLIHAQDSANN